MRFSRIFAIVVAVVCLMVTTAFAAPSVLGMWGGDSTQQKSDTAKMEKNHSKGQKCDGFSKDPLKALQSRKEKVQSLLKDGKITKEKADAMNARIDSKIKEVQQFNSLTLQQKKDKLVNDFKAFAEKRVKEGKIEQTKADTMVKNYTDKITKWDGSGYPQFHGKRFKSKSTEHNTDKQ